MNHHRVVEFRATDEATDRFLPLVQDPDATLAAGALPAATPASIGLQIDPRFARLAGPVVKVIAAGRTLGARQVHMLKIDDSDDDDQALVFLLVSSYYSSVYVVTATARCSRDEGCIVTLGLPVAPKLLLQAVAAWIQYRMAGDADMLQGVIAQRLQLEWLSRSTARCDLGSRESVYVPRKQRRSRKRARDGDPPSKMTTTTIPWPSCWRM